MTLNRNADAVAGTSLHELKAPAEFVGMLARSAKQGLRDRRSEWIAAMVERKFALREIAQALDIPVETLRGIISRWATRNGQKGGAGQGDTPPAAGVEFSDMTADGSPRAATASKRLAIISNSGFPHATVNLPREPWGPDQQEVCWLRPESAPTGPTIRMRENLSQRGRAGKAQLAIDAIRQELIRIKEQGRGALPDSANQTIAQDGRA